MFQTLGTIFIKNKKNKKGCIKKVYLCTLKKKLEAKK